MADSEQRSRQAQAILENEIFQEVCAEIDKEAIDAVRQSTSNEELIAARAKLLAVSLVKSRVEAIQNRFSYERARPARVPLA